MSAFAPPARTIPDMKDIRHDEWMAMSEEEYRRIGELLAGLDDDDDWHQPTDCTEWDVRELVAHLVGNSESSASIRELRRQQKLGRRLRPGGPDIDGMTAVQVQERAALSPKQLVDDLADVAVRAVRARRRIPAVVRAIPVPLGPPVGTRPIGYLMDRIFTRDAWMHRIDLARATGRPLQLTADHDGRLVADVVADWAKLHGQPFTLTLTGPAGGSWARGTDGEAITLDAIEFCRILSGRASGNGLLTTAVPF
jgi:uncharacterized protein (TIGR03083 family)